MNIYTTRFSALCPVNGQGIDYTLTIQTGEVLLVEAIREALDGIKEGLHEHIADQLCAKFGGSQRLKAMHHGVEIETIRPHLAHWEKPEAPRVMTAAEMRQAAAHDSSFVGAFARARP